MIRVYEEDKAKLIIFINTFCQKCGYCCRQLNIIDRIIISFQLREMVGKICHYSTKNGCLVRYKEPEYCKKWNCGVTSTLKNEFYKHD
jgi:hypothetical protein